LSNTELKNVWKKIFSDQSPPLRIAKVSCGPNIRPYAAEVRRTFCGSQFWADTGNKPIKLMVKAIFRIYFILDVQNKRNEDRQTAQIKQTVLWLNYLFDLFLINLFIMLICGFSPWFFSGVWHVYLKLYAINHIHLFIFNFLWFFLWLNYCSCMVELLSVYIVIHLGLKTLSSLDSQLTNQ
jgi:hypothetical protein